MSLMAILGWAHPLLRPKTMCKQISFRALAVRVRWISSQQAVWDLSSETSILTTSSMRSFLWGEYPHNKLYEIFPVRWVSSQLPAWDRSSETNILTRSCMRSFQWDKYLHNKLCEMFPKLTALFWSYLSVTRVSLIHDTLLFIEGRGAICVHPMWWAAYCRTYFTCLFWFYWSKGMVLNFTAWSNIWLLERDQHFWKVILCSFFWIRLNPPSPPPPPPPPPPIF